DARGPLRPRLVASPPDATDARRRARLAARRLPDRSRDPGPRSLLAPRDPGRALVHRAHGAAPAPDDDGAAAPPAGRAASTDPVGPAGAAPAAPWRARDPPRSRAADPRDAHVDAHRPHALHGGALGLASSRRLRGGAPAPAAARSRALDLLRDG